MPKQEVGSTKWLGNKMKAKGLQKLRWYCQMCQKQCRDENGFKCHRMSDGHQRQMQVFTQDPNRFMDEFSQEFEKGFMQLMSHTYRSTRVLANTVYCDFISNRHHTHMNSTIWVTLSNFVQYLGRTKQCKIDKTPKGWYLQYIDNSPEARMREIKLKEMENFELSHEERQNMLLKKAVKEAMQEGGFVESEFTELQRQEGDAPIAFSMSAGSSSSSTAAAIAATAAVAAKGSAAGSAAARKTSPSANVLAEAFETHEGKRKKETKETKISTMESIKLEQEAFKRRKVEAEKAPPSPSESPSEQEPWVAVGLIVKVMHKDLAGGKYHKKKGKIEKVHNNYTADVRMTETRDLIRLEQELLETVIPNVGRIVQVVKGLHKGKKATMRAVDIGGFCVTVELDDGGVVKGLGYDQVCKIEEAVKIED